MHVRRGRKPQHGPRRRFQSSAVRGEALGGDSKAGSAREMRRNSEAAPAGAVQAGRGGPCLCLRAPNFCVQSVTLRSSATRHKATGCSRSTCRSVCGR
ncbi:hypothetical protein NDU88_001326 [Pleurodeles waltl]|uniref:Uncharacterized protein n=1 Tax=Pleurodeles waltl TaxID=8319 RepID=A0AAV7SCN4_PLEWA|nr:hypothetical protein NDU88_001326 [Pleurodeles waltl]